MSLGVLTEAEGIPQPMGHAGRAADRCETRGAALVADENSFWVAAESLPMLHSVYPAANLEPQISAPEPFASRAWSPEEALTEIVRGRLQALGLDDGDGARQGTCAVSTGSIEAALGEAGERGLRPARPVHERCGRYRMV